MKIIKQYTKQSEKKTSQWYGC